MKTNKILLSGLIGGIAFFLLGWLIYGILLEEFMKNNYNQCANKPMEQMNWIALIASNLLSGLLIAMVCSWAGANNLMSGLKTGAILGFLMGAAFDLSIYSMTDVFLGRRALVLDIATYTIMTAIAAAIIGQFNSMGAAKEE